MTCRDLMTAAPACCLPSDSAATAAQIMKREDVGPVLVVNEHTSQQLTGIVTDRDLALKIVAEGRDPHNTRVDEVMSRFPVTCRTDDDVSSALKAMAENLRAVVAGAFDQLTGWNPHNYFLYHDAKRDRWRYLPWDLDVGFCATAAEKSSRPSSAARTGRPDGSC